MPEPNRGLPEARQLGDQRPYALLLAGLLILALVAICILGINALNWYATHSPNVGMTATVCAGFTTTPKIRFGLAWQSMVSSYLSPLTISPFAICTNVPHNWLTAGLPIHSWEWLWP